MTKQQTQASSPQTVVDITGTRQQPPPAPLSLAEFAKRVVVAVLVTVVILLLIYLLGQVMHVLLEAFAGVLFAIFLASLSDWVSRRTRLSYGWSLLAVVLGCLLIAIALGWLLANRIALQLSELREQLPQSVQQLRQYLEQFPWGAVLLDALDRSRDGLSQSINWQRVVGIVSGVANFLVAVVIVLFVGIFGAAQASLYRAGLLHLVPRPHRKRVVETLNAIVYNLRWWLVGQVLLMVVIGTTTTLGLWLIGIPLALALGTIAGILELIPYVGPWLSAIPAVLIALTISPGHLLLVGALYLGLHIVEGYVLLPLVQNRVALVPPALTLVTQAALGEMFGILGLFLAAPLTVALMVLLKILYVEDTLGDQAIDVPGEPGNECKPAAQAARSQPGSQKL
jgi:predicted PurR-regulated permease PerM